MRVAADVSRLVIRLAPLLLGVVWIAFDERKQAWHDKMARTVVIHRRR